MKKLLLIASLAAFVSPAIAADIVIPVKAVAPLPAPCSPGSCSGWYAGFGLVGSGTSADIIGSGIDGSVFAAGGALKVQGGYQFWSGSLFAAIEASVGYGFSSPVGGNVPLANPGNFGNNLMGFEIVKLGYNFFPSQQQGVTVPSQSPVQLIVPANLLAASTPYLAFGGYQHNGRNVWVSGAGVQTVVAKGWTLDPKYLYAPEENGFKAESLVLLELNKHF